MKKFMYYLRKIILFVGMLVLFSSITAALNLIGVSKVMSSVILLIFQLMLFFTLGFIHGKKTIQKAIFVGFRVSFILIIILLLLSVVFYNYSFKLSNIIFYVILCCTCVFGSIIGKNKK